jgi:2-desacetyl-2-hydroxyethyl bacteriochlorophyllide A dehydrogenase
MNDCIMMNKIILLNPYQFEKRKVDFPTLKEGEILVQIKRIGICGTDIHAFHGNQPFFSYPRVLGHELSGIVVEEKANNKNLLGNGVAILPYLSCGKCNSCQREKTNCCANLKVMGVHVDGGFSEYLAVPQSNIILGNGLNLDYLSLVEPLSISYHGVWRADISDQDWVIVFGAGPIGLGALIFAKSKTDKIIIIDVNEHRIQFCKDKIGIYHAYNGHDLDLIEKIKTLTNGNFADIVMDATGNIQAMHEQINYLAHGGKWILIGLQKEELSISQPEFHKREATLMSSRNATKSDFQQVINKMNEHKINPSIFMSHNLLFEEVTESFYETIKDQSLIKGIIKVNELEKG